METCFDEYLDGHELSIVLAPGNCVHPIHIKWPGEEFMAPHLPDGRSLYSVGLVVGCGKCPACQAGKRREWFTRIMMEYKTCSTCYFITLTYNDEHLPENGVCKKDCQDFMKRLRKQCPQSHLRFFLCSEYGSKSHRPHYHMILFNFPSTDATVVSNSVLEAWSPRGDCMGFVYVAGFGEAAAMYVTKYVLKDKNILAEYLPDELLDEYDPEYTYVPENDGLESTFQLASRKPALGFYFFEDADLVEHLHELQEPFIRLDGKKFIMPRYAKLQVFDKWERKQMFEDYICDKVDLLMKQIERYGSSAEVHRLVKDKAIDKNRNIIRNRNKQKGKEKV